MLCRSRGLTADAGGGRNSPAFLASRAGRSRNAIFIIPHAALFVNRKTAQIFNLRIQKFVLDAQ